AAHLSHTIALPFASFLYSSLAHRALHSFPTRRSSDLHMAFDGIVIANLVRDFKESLEGGRVTKIAQPEKDELLFTIKSSSSFSRSEEHTSELQSRFDLVCRLLLEKKKQNNTTQPKNYR